MFTFRSIAFLTVVFLALGSLTVKAQHVPLPGGGIASGTLQTNAAGDRIYAFRGIPYAEPPVGDRRWAQATLKSLDGDVNATAFGKICYGDGRVDAQSSSFPASEDCLFLNVYAPANATSDSRLPVMVWIHGGGFVAGASNIYDGANLIGAAPNNRLIVVTLNYRLSVFGLLSGDVLKRERADGVNFALRDQEVAFQWVKRYISLFGGDDGNVTAFGESAGAKSVFAHLIARGGTQTLFQRAILQSGTYTTAHTVPTTDRQNAVFSRIVAQVGCDAETADDSAVLSCLREANASALWAAGGRLVWQPVVDGVFLLDVPLTSLLVGKISPVPAIIGTNTDEGWLMAIAVKAAADVLPFVDQRFPLLTATERARLEALYPTDGFVSPTHRAAEIYGDAMYVCPSELVSLGLSQLTGSTYRYRFNQTSTTFGSPLAVHTAELRYVFNIAKGLAQDVATTAFVSRLRRFWTAFAATGSPNGVTMTKPPSGTCVDELTAVGDATASAFHWPQYDVTRRRQIVLQSNGLVVETTRAHRLLRDERCVLWWQIEERLAPTLAGGDA